MSTEQQWATLQLHIPAEQFADIDLDDDSLPIPRARSVRCEDDLTQMPFERVCTRLVDLFCMQWKRLTVVPDRILVHRACVDVARRAIAEASLNIEPADHPAHELVEAWKRLEVRSLP